ncbi:hypothetical protein LCGC14_1013680 [marine sediment metagenome]|uniref:PD-(D/E)XK endonuclease-like domain-containing protein n=1 Tax=marine sediment metagenome TaxID=412755 RepID=A0A0F9MZH4_9ZZZZ
MIKGIIRPGGELMLKDAAIAEAIQMGNLDGYPLLIVTAALNDWKRTNPSASQIAGGSWRRSVLEATIAYYIKIGDRMPLLRGSLIHKGFEGFRSPPGVQLIREKTMRAHLPKFPEMKLSGTIDLYYPAAMRIEDYKTCSKMPKLVKPAHVWQLATYAWLLRWNGYAVKHGAINYQSWRDCLQLSRTLDESGSEISIAEAKLFCDEQFFVQETGKVWIILKAGYTDYDIPSMVECNTNWCRGCAVKWACDQIDRWGGVIDPADYSHEDYV